MLIFLFIYSIILYKQKGVKLAMKCDPQRTIEKQREAARIESRKKRQEKLDTMTPQKNVKFFLKTRNSVFMMLYPYLVWQILC